VSYCTDPLLTVTLALRQSLNPPHPSQPHPPTHPPEQKTTDGSATPYYAAYGATKAALPQLAKTLRAELSSSSSNAASGSGQPPRQAVGVHVLSPGMMLTDLLLEGASPANLQVGGMGRLEPVCGFFRVGG